MDEILRISRKQEMLKLRLEDGLTLDEIGVRFGISGSAVMRAIGKTGYIARKNIRDEWKRLRFGERRTLKEIADKYGVSYQVVQHALGKTGTIERLSPEQLNEIWNLRFRNGASLKEISERFDVPERKIRSCFRRFLG